MILLWVSDDLVLLTLRASPEHAKVIHARDVAILLVDCLTQPVQNRIGQVHNTVAA